MKAFITCMVFCALSSFVIAQNEYALEKTYHDITLQTFIEELENSSDLSFFYQAEWLDSTMITEINAGTLIKDFLSTELKKHGLSFYSKGQNIFLYPGTAISTTLPDFEKNIPSNQFVDRQLDDTTKSNEYIQTRQVLSEQKIVIGDRQNAVTGRPCKIKGTIINQRDNEPMVGATIYIKELEKGSISDVNGNFELQLKYGNYSISVNHMAMKEKHYELQVFSDGAFAIELQDEIIELEEVTISNDRFDNVKSIRMGVERVTIKAMKEIPVVMGEKDILKVAQMLPGVQNVGEGSSGFNVRGGSPDQNMFYFNNISVYNTSHLFGFFTAFSPDVVNDFTLYKNNIPTKYGGRLASVFDISTRNGNKNEFFAQAGISPVTGHFSFEGPIIKEKVSVVGSFRSTYSDWILKRMNDEDLRESNASFYDGTLGINSDINESNQLKVFFYRSSDKFSLSSLNDYNYSNNGASVIWKHKFSSTLSSDVSFASSNYQFSNTNKNNISDAYTQDYNIFHNEFRVDFLELKHEKHRIEYGLSSILYSLNRGTISPYGEESNRIPLELGEEQGLENALYISDEINLLPSLTMMLGLRFSMYSQLGPQKVLSYFEGLPLEQNNVNGETNYTKSQFIKSYSGLEPRLAFNYLLNKRNSIKASYNRLHQYIFLLSNTIAISPDDQWKLVDSHLSPPVSDQVSLGYYHDSKSRGLSLSVEVYNKWINNSIDFKNGANFISGTPIEQLLLQGKQNAKGVEFLVKKNSNKLTGWMSYTYSRSFLEMDGAFPSERINGGRPYPSNFDRPHSFNFVSNYRSSRRLSFSANVVYSSGRPITLPVSVYYSEGQQLLLYSDRNEYRIPDYFRIDFSINLEGNLKSKKFGHSYWMFNVYNLTGRANAYSVFYKAEEGIINGYKLSIFARPIVTLSWHFKLGNYDTD